MKNRVNAPKPSIPTFVARLGGGFYVARLDDGYRVMTLPTVPRTRQPSQRVREVMDREFTSATSAADTYVFAQVQDLLERCRP